jgi:hypothetical protein
MNTNQVIPNVYGPSTGGSVVRETTTVTKEFDSKGRVVKETTITDKETYTSDKLPSYYPTWTGTFTNHYTTGDGIKYGVAQSDTKDLE